jgi:hypothetical protein
MHCPSPAKPCASPAGFRAQLQPTHHHHRTLCLRPERRSQQQLSLPNPPPECLAPAYIPESNTIELAIQQKKYSAIFFSSRPTCHAFITHFPDINPCPLLHVWCPFHLPIKVWRFQTTAPTQTISNATNQCLAACLLSLQTYQQYMYSLLSYGDMVTRWHVADSGVENAVIKTPTTFFVTV